MDSEVFLVTKTPRGTLRLKVVKTVENNGRWYLRLAEGGGKLWADGNWVPQTQVSAAR